MSARYTAEAVSVGDGRDGEVRSDDGVIDEKLAVPAELGGRGGDATNPEQLFAAGYSACFHSAVLQAARLSGIKVADSRVATRVAIEVDEADSGYRLAVNLRAHLPGLNQPQADELVEAAHQMCPYSKATRGNVPVRVSATV
ncbi:organic hydroperoxide resistance protein [Actinoalloteichus spitiensis]|uniref:organic hydroperoxide resistance protein n=1 Tax=Actinoalloteichus spitiensis TaxID=252394 RepID=UPI00035ED52A|nr:organic hydroperoxide resistance protein [Actinoalloteichus spitiensis]